MGKTKASEENGVKWPVWDKEDLEAVEAVLRSNQWWAGAPGLHAGENVWEFQKEFAAYHEAKHCIAVANGTVALEIALLALDVGMGDEVIVPDYTFVASAMAVVATNAVPIFCDIDPESLVLDVAKAERLLTPRTKAIVAVHLGGNPVDMVRLCRLAADHHLKIIEDCAHAHGSRFSGKRVGNWGHTGTFSFQASKLLTAGEGGCVICNDDELASRIYGISDCGRRSGDYFYAHYHYGSNYRMPEFQAAVLRTQLKKFPLQHEKRNRNAKYLGKRLGDIEGISVMKPTRGTEELGYYVYPFLFDPQQFKGITKAQFYASLRQAGIPTADCYPPLHTLGCFRDRALRKGIDYSGANWGGEKSDDRFFPVTSETYSRSVELAQELLLTREGYLDSVADVIEGLKD